MSLRSAWIISFFVLGGAVPAQDPGTLAREVLRDGGYQTELPDRRWSYTGSETGHGSEKDESDRPEGDASGGRPREGSGSFTISVDDGPGLLLWIILAAVAVILIAQVVAGARRRHRDVTWERAPRGGVAAAPVVPSFPPPDEAERLAAEGRYGEAIRLLLHRAFDAVARSGALRLAPSMTSREALRKAELPAEAGSSLGTLIAAEERSLFARRPPALEDYEACAAEYRALVRAGSPRDA